MQLIESPWGHIDFCATLIEDVAYVVGTPSHGGIMIYRNNSVVTLSPEALKEAQSWRNWLCYEEDCAWHIPVYESNVLLTAYIEENADHFNESTLEYHIDRHREALALMFPEYLILHEYRQWIERAQDGETFTASVTLRANGGVPWQYVSRIEAGEKLSFHYEP